MEDLRAQLDVLRARIKAIEARGQPNATEEPLPGVEVVTPRGRHLEMETLSERHGGFHFGRLETLSCAAVAAISDGLIADCNPYRMAFLDTETTGLAGGAGTVPFLVGVGRLTSRGFLVKQFFMRDFSEEPSMLHALTAMLAESDVLVTYNGRSFDEPLLATRYTLARQRPPFARLQHLDLLHGARRLWKLRFDSCKLVELEAQVLGEAREGDVPGGQIPQLYFDYLRTKRPGRLNAVFRHNALDILSLAALTAILPARFDRSEVVHHAAEMVGLGRWLASRGDKAAAVPLFERAIATIEFDRLPAARRRDVFLALARHFERTQKDLPRAVAMAEELVALDARSASRLTRLQRKLRQGCLPG